MATYDQALADFASNAKAKTAETSVKETSVSINKVTKIETEDESKRKRKTRTYSPIQENGGSGVITVSLGNEVKEIVIKLAKAKGLSVSSYIRYKLIEEAKNLGYLK